MKPVYITLAAVVGMAATATAGPKEDLAAAVKKLEELGTYSWKSTSGSPGSDRGMRESNGKVNKGGLLYYATQGRDSETIVIKEKEKVVVKGRDGWRSTEEISADSGGGEEGNRRRRGGWMARMVRDLKPPTATAEEIISDVEKIEVVDGVYTATMEESKVKEMFSFGRGRRGGGGGGDRPAPEVSNAKGTAKFWVKDGVLEKFETETSASMSFNGQARDMKRKRVVEIGEVGEAKIEVPEEAKAKLGG